MSSDCHRFMRKTEISYFLFLLTNSQCAKISLMINQAAFGTVRASMFVDADVIFQSTLLLSPPPPPPPPYSSVIFVSTKTVDHRNHRKLVKLYQSSHEVPLKGRESIQNGRLTALVFIPDGSDLIVGTTAHDLDEDVLLRANALCNNMTKPDKAHVD